MKKTKILSIILVIAIMLSTFTATARVLATEPESTVPGDNARTAGEGEPVTTSEGEGEPVTTSEGGDDGHTLGTDNLEIRSGDLYIANADSEYVMDQNVDGNVYIFGNNVKITGSINGSLFVAASKVTIDEQAYIACHIFAAADTIEMNGIAFDLYAAGRNVRFNEGSIISRDMRVTGSEIYLGGAVGRDAYAYGGKVTASPEEGKLIIYGNLNYEATKEMENLDKAQISGETNFNKAKENEDGSNTVLDYVLSAIGTIIFDVVLYLLFIFFAPKFVGKSKEYVSTKGLLAFAVGLAFTILVPILAIILFITGVGAGLGFFSLFVYGILLMLNAFIVALSINEFVAEKLKFVEDKFKKGLLLIPISLVLWGIREIPFIGSWISTLVFLCGVGIMVFYQFDKKRKAKTVEK